MACSSGDASRPHTGAALALPQPFLSTVLIGPPACAAAAVVRSLLCSRCRERRLRSTPRSAALRCTSLQAARLPCAWLPHVGPPAPSRRDPRAHASHGGLLRPVALLHANRRRGRRSGSSSGSSKHGGDRRRARGGGGQRFGRVRDARRCAVLPDRRHRRARERCDERVTVSAVLPHPRRRGLAWLGLAWLGLAWLGSRSAPSLRTALRRCCAFL